MRAKILHCHISIKYGDVIQSWTVPCWEYEDGSRFLIIPIEEFPRVKLNRAHEMMLAMPASAFLDSTDAGYALRCPDPIDLDSYGLLTWKPQEM